MLKETLEADVAIVETVAHTKSALHYYDDVDVIVDVGGQDIKVIVLKDGKVKDFKLNTQCSAGNGYFLQNTAAKFGYSVAEFADVAFDAERLPVFGYGCAVFMETDIVNFQQLGWEKREIMAGLAKVLPKNIWSLFRRQKAEMPVAAVVREMRSKVRIAMPRVLNMYTLAPFLQAYFEALGVGFRQIMYSDFTDPLMWYKGSRRGSIDQCFPSKVSLAHIHNLIEKLTAPERAAPHKAKEGEG